MKRVLIVDSNPCGSAHLIAGLLTERGVDAVVVEPRKLNGGVWALLAYDECVQPHTRKGKGQRKANRANRWK